MNTLVRCCGLILVLLTSLFFVKYALDNWSLIAGSLIYADTLPSVLAGLFCYLNAFLISAIAWHLLLRAVGASPRLPGVLTALLLSQFAKYLPGNVGQHISRAVLAHKMGLTNASIAVTMVLEILLVILAAGGTGLLALWLNNSLLLSSLPQVAAPGKIALLCLLPLALLAGLWLAKSFGLKRLTARFGITSVSLPRPPCLLACYLLYSVNFLIMGLILYLLMAAFGGGPATDFWLLTGVFSLAWIAGFITPGAPAGIGLREAVLVATLDPLYGSAMALSLAIALRLITTSGDGLGFLIGMALRQWLKRNPRRVIN
ncbi:lysylphosphatidylglycerol synthase transmembrane domain-containing protein [Shewanella salipaludis]|uniref:Uncharacterized protein n=1 Tax=Shewanella salipaludis TaxID=2723052 RepID=A0A972FRM2_9GAMM|nr:YbhN family protein [Shewanella salipaludis]NMH64855.1 hypothetical protein [Shewanella salipaludis]